MEGGLNGDASASSLRFARQMLAMAQSLGLSVAEVVETTGLDAADVEGFVLPALDTAQLGRLGSRLAGLLARHANMAEGRAPLRPGDWRVFLYCLLAGRTLRDALLHAGDAFQALDGRCGQIELRENGAIAEVRIDSLRSGPSLVGCAVDLNGVASIHGLLGWLIGRPLPLRSIQIAYDDALYRRLDLGNLPYPVITGAAWTGFSFAAAWLDLPVLRALDELAGRGPQSFLFDVDGTSAGLPLPERVRRFAIRALRSRGRLPSFADVGAHLGISEPTLRRHLAGQGASYRNIKASCRRELGLELLGQPQLSIEDIAARLDFCDADAFRGAFREWFGKPPAAYRRELAVSASASQYPDPAD